MNGQQINESADLASLVSEMKPGTKATLEVWRNGTPMTIVATVDKLDQRADVADSGSADSDRAPLGLQVRPLTSEGRKAGSIMASLSVKSAEPPPMPASSQATWYWASTVRQSGA